MVNKLYRLTEMSDFADRAGYLSSFSNRPAEIISYYFKKIPSHFSFHEYF